jgi:hypothetical protein
MVAPNAVCAGNGKGGYSGSALGELLEPLFVDDFDLVDGFETDQAVPP